MGEYRGKGVRSGGGSSVVVYERFVWYGAHNVYQKITTTITRYPGVSKSTAEGYPGSCDMGNYQFVWDGGKWHWSLNCKGSRRSVSYSQIGDSNLYDLVVTDESISARLDNGEWV